jgi:hypothetical protein
MDSKIVRINELKTQRQKIDEELVKLKAELQQEVQAAVRNGKPRKKRAATQKQLPLNGPT